MFLGCFDTHYFSNIPTKRSQGVKDQAIEQAITHQRIWKSIFAETGSLMKTWIILPYDMVLHPVEAKNRHPTYSSLEIKSLPAFVHIFHH